MLLPFCNPASIATKNISPSPASVQIFGSSFLSRKETNQFALVVGDRAVQKSCPDRLCQTFSGSEFPVGALIYSCVANEGEADSCPVVDLTMRIVRAHGVPVKILCDTAHRIQREDAETLVFDKGADSVDSALVNRVTPGDIGITQESLPACARPGGPGWSTRTGWSTQPGISMFCRPAATKIKNASVPASPRKGRPNARGNRMKHLPGIWRKSSTNDTTSDIFHKKKVSYLAFCTTFRL